MAASSDRIAGQQNEACLLRRHKPTMPGLGLLHRLHEISNLGRADLGRQSGR
jgi:hypothetical protein